MKIIVDELNKGNYSVYKITKYNDKNIKINERTIYFILSTVTIKDYTYYLLHDQDGNLCKELFNYINDYNFTSSTNSKIKMIQFVKRLLEYSSIIDVPIHKMKFKEFNGFQYFISGLQIPLSNYVFYTNRSAGTISSRNIINRCKNYIKYCGYKNGDFLKFQKVGRFRYTDNFDCPKFISIKEFNNINKYINNDTSLSLIDKTKYQCIYKLMFNGGLRIGEVLGLTIEDFEQIYSDSGKKYYKIYIRNRFSDMHHQKAKRCLNIIDKSMYVSSEYHKKNVGYQIAYITEDLYNDIMDYFDLNFDKFAKVNKSYPEADSINNDRINYYIFTNSNKATCLSLYMVYKYTRKMFVELGYPIDYKKNKNNLLHRFRHGYAMKLLYLYKLDPFEVIHYTRHASVRSLEAYNNPTDEQLTSILERVEEI